MRDRLVELAVLGQAPARFQQRRRAQLRVVVGERHHQQGAAPRRRSASAPAGTGRSGAAPWRRSPPRCGRHLAVGVDRGVEVAPGAAGPADAVAGLVSPRAAGEASTTPLVSVPALVPGADQREGVAQPQEGAVGQAGDVLERRVVAEDDQPLDRLADTACCSAAPRRRIVGPADERALRVGAPPRRTGPAPP